MAKTTSNLTSAGTLADLDTGDQLYTVKGGNSRRAAIGTLKHIMDLLEVNDPPESQSVLGTGYPTYGYLRIDDDSTGGVASVHTVGLHVHHVLGSGHVGGITAGQFVNEWAAAPASMSGGVAALRAITSIATTADLSSFSGAVPEGFVTSCLVGGGFTGMMIGHVAVAGAFGNATPTQRYTMMLLDEGAATHSVLGSTYDAHLCLTSAGGAGARDMILINNCFGAFPTAAAGASNIMKIRGGTPSFTDGIDISSATYSGNAFKSPGFSVNALGAVWGVSGTGIPAGGSVLVGFYLTSSAMGVFVGSGAPTLSAPQGSLYLRSDGSTTNNRAYIATNSSGSWTALTTAA